MIYYVSGSGGGESMRAGVERHQVFVAGDDPPNRATPAPLNDIASLSAESI